MKEILKYTISGLLGFLMGYGYELHPLAVILPAVALGIFATSEYYETKKGEEKN